MCRVRGPGAVAIVEIVLAVEQPCVAAAVHQP
jgi:hypothetical protein